MPIYEYRCDSCGHYLDVLQKLTDEPLKECPECQASLRRLISAPSFRLKGGGWYETDFKSDKERRRNLAEGSKDKSEASGDNSSDKSGGSDGKRGGSDDKSGARDDKRGGSDTSKAADKGAGADAGSKKESKDKGKGSAKSSGTEAA
jgi:putative FmdB family regulatory protein